MSSPTSRHAFDEPCLRVSTKRARRTRGKRNGFEVAFSRNKSVRKPIVRVTGSYNSGVGVRVYRSLGCHRSRCYWLRLDENTGNQEITARARSTTSMRNAGDVHKQYCLQFFPASFYTARKYCACWSCCNNGSVRETQEMQSQLDGNKNPTDWRNHRLRCDDDRLTNGTGRRATRTDWT
jgi:hypothetical protein